MINDNHEIENDIATEESGGEEIKDAKQRAKETVEEIVDKAKDIVDDIVDGVEGTIEGLAEATEGIAEDFKDKYLKVLAEMENLRKRFEQERTEMNKYKAQSFLMSILPTVDMFNMAMKTKDVSDEIKNWLVGFEMILNNFNSVLQNEGVTEINVKVGDEFDANYHFAMEEVETDEVEPGKVALVKLKGYMLHDKLLRPASVAVAKAKNTEEENQEKDTEGENNE